MCEKNNLNLSNYLKKKKIKKKAQKFDHPYLTNAYCKLIKIHCVAFLRWWAATMQKPHAFLIGSWSYACVKIVF